jgi:DNA-binding MarR family transcriptional regulator
MFNLDTFLPYRLSILSQAVSGLIANEYESQFGLTINQWRCLVIIQTHQPVTAKDIGSITLLDKMAISRALKILKKRSLISSTPGLDARSQMLNLTKTGQKIYDEVIPIAINYETRLLSSLTTVQQSVLEGIIKKLTQEAQELSAQK